MTKLTREIWINAPKNKVWDALADFGNVYIMNPNVPTSKLTSRKTSGTGVTRRCDLGGSSFIDERITRWEEGKLMAIDVYNGKGTPPWKNPNATLEVREKDGGTLLHGTFEYQMKLGPIGSLMDKMMVTPQFGKAWGNFMAGIKKHVETGAKIDGPEGLDVSAIRVPA